MKLLDGIRVLDMARLIPGPMLTMLLADLGANVIKVEEKKVGDYLRIGSEPEKFGGSIPLFLWTNRNKRDISVDLKAPEGRRAVLDLAKTCQVAVEGSRPGVEAKLGLGNEDLKAVNPSIIYCSITGFGQDGPFAQLATHGGAYDAIAGLAVPLQVKDDNYVQHRPYPHSLTYGSWAGAMGVCAALVRGAAHRRGCLPGHLMRRRRRGGAGPGASARPERGRGGLAGPERRHLRQVLLLQDEGRPVHADPGH